MIFNIIKYIEITLYIYFTTLPYDIYRHASNVGNLGIAGIGLQLMYSQKIFWISNILLFLIKYNELYDIYNKSYDIYILLLCGYLYSISLYKIYYYINYLLDL